MTSPWEKLLDVSRLTDVDLCAVASACQGEMYGWDAKLRAVLDRLVVQQGALSQERGHGPPKCATCNDKKFICVKVDFCPDCNAQPGGHEPPTEPSPEIVALIEGELDGDWTRATDAERHEIATVVAQQIIKLLGPSARVDRGVDREPPAELDTRDPRRCPKCGCSNLAHWQAAGAVGEPPSLRERTQRDQFVAIVKEVADQLAPDEGYDELADRVWAALLQALDPEEK